MSDTIRSDVAGPPDAGPPDAGACDVGTTAGTEAAAGPRDATPEPAGSGRGGSEPAAPEPALGSRLPAQSERAQRSYVSGHYWAKRSDLLYYRYIDYIMRVAATEARSLIDVGTGGCPYLEWFDWIPERVSFDLRSPYRSEAVQGIAGNLMTHEFERRFDVCTCLQVLEHVPDAAAFARRLLEIARLVVISVPHGWPAGRTTGHVHDPVTEEKLEGWMGRRPNYSILVREPFRTVKGERIIALYDEDPRRRFGSAAVENRRIRETAL